MIEEFKNVSEEKMDKVIAKASNVKKNEDFYQKLRLKMKAFVDEHPNSKYLNFVIAAPDMFHLMCKLIIDTRVPVKSKFMVAGAITYFVSPIDILPDVVPGLGWVDDVFIAAKVINHLLDSVDKEFVLEHWAGDENVFNVIKHILELTEQVLDKEKIKKLLGSWTRNTIE